MYVMMQGCRSFLGRRIAEFWGEEDGESRIERKNRRESDGSMEDGEQKELDIKRTER